MDENTDADHFDLYELDARRTALDSAMRVLPSHSSPAEILAVAEQFAAFLTGIPH